MSISIRKAQLEDSSQIAALSGQLGYGADHEAMLGRLSTLLAMPDHSVLIALKNGETVGWIHGCETYRVASDAFVEIGGLVVDAQARRSGIGQQLVESLQAWAEARGYTKLRVRCNSKRIESHAFYKHIGFELSKEQKALDKAL